MTTPLRPRRAAFALFAVVLMLSACATDDDTTAIDADTSESTAAPPTAEPVTTDATDDATTVPGDESPAPADTATPVAVPPALQFTAPLVGGGEFDGATVADKPTLFWFWAPT